MDYGSDFLLVDDDIVFTPDGDIALVSGPRTIAQDIDQALKTAIGRLIWNPEAGSTMPLMLNDSESDSNAVISELERVAIADRRVDPVSVSARRLDAKRYRLEFTPAGAVTPETLEYDLSKGDWKNA
jgi:phage baseplate assembly protein W